MSAPWRQRLHDGLRETGSPLLWGEDEVVPAASLWMGMRLWVKRARAAGLVPEDRVVLCTEDHPAFVMAVLAALWERWDLWILPPGTDPAVALERTGARVVVTDTPTPLSWAVEGRIGPADAVVVHGEPTGCSPGLTFASADGVPHPQSSPEALAAEVDRWAATLDREGGAAVSVLCWHEPLGMAADLLANLATAKDVFRLRDPDPGRLVELLGRFDRPHLTADVKRFVGLMAREAGREAVAALGRGVVVGPGAQQVVGELRASMPKAPLVGIG